MQKFGLQPNRKNHCNAIEVELAREQASALGRAGRKLRVSLEHYEKRRHLDLSAEQEQSCIKEISENVWALVVQREFLGFVEGNLKWVTDNYRIPDAAIKSLGRI